MGFGDNERLRKFEVKYFGISHVGDAADAKHIEMKVPNPSTGQLVTKYVERHDYVEGRVIKAEWYSREDNEKRLYRGYTLTMDVGDEVVLLDFPIPYKKPTSAIYRLLVRHGENVDWSKPLKISAWETKNDQGKPKTGVCFWQKDADGKEISIKSAHTKENPNGCPPPADDDGELDWKPVERWLKLNFDAKVIPAIQQAAAGYVPQVAVKKAAPIVVAEEEDDEPMPAGKSSRRASDEADDPFGDFDDLPEFAGAQPQARAASATQASHQKAGFGQWEKAGPDVGDGQQVPF